MWTMCTCGMPEYHLVSPLGYYHNDCLHAGPRAGGHFESTDCSFNAYNCYVCPPVFWGSGGTPNAANVSIVFALVSVVRSFAMSKHN